MIKEMKGWKVISSGRESCRLRQYRYFKDNYGNDHKKWVIVYPVGVEVFPKVKGSKIFVFKEKDDAESFADFGEVVVPCVAKNAVKVKWICETIGGLANFWEERRKSETRGKAPEGTYLAESITCLE